MPIEMQRYFSFASQISITADEPNTIIVSHPGLIDDATAQSIDIQTLKLVTRTGGWYNSEAKPTIQFDPATPGMATLVFADPWPGKMPDMPYYPGMSADRQRLPEPAPEAIHSANIREIILKVQIPDYVGSEANITSKSTTLTF